jgi:hypothetical protein
MCRAAPAAVAFRRRAGAARAVELRRPIGRRGEGSAVRFTMCINITYTYAHIVGW